MACREKRTSCQVPVSEGLAIFLTFPTSIPIIRHDAKAPPPQSRLKASTHNRLSKTHSRSVDCDSGTD